MSYRDQIDLDRRLKLIQDAQRRSYLREKDLKDQPQEQTETKGVVSRILKRVGIIKSHKRKHYSKHGIPVPTTLSEL